VTCLLVMMLASHASPVHGHGRFPAAGLVAIDPVQGQHLVARVREAPGVVVSRDGGDTWHWVCPKAIGIDAETDPPTVVTNNGAIIAATFNGLSVTTEGCNWISIGGEASGRNFIDLAPRKNGNGTVALSAAAVATDSFETDLWETTDDPHAWTHLAHVSRADFLATGIAVGLDLPQRIYLSGRDGLAARADRAASYRGVVLRSDDNGNNWTRIATPGSDGMATLPYLAGIDPRNADRVYVANVRTVEGKAASFELLASDDGGDSWQVAAEVPTPISAFAISPNGNKLAFGGELAGLWVGDAGTLAFEKTSAVQVRCLAWHARGIYACGDPFFDPFALGLSVDDGRTFVPVMTRSDPCGVDSCAESSSAGACKSAWPPVANALGASLQCPANNTTATSPTNGSCGYHQSRAEVPTRNAFSLVLSFLALVLARRRWRPSWRRQRPRLDPYLRH